MTTDQTTFECALCREVFPLIRDERWSEEKAQNELAENFPGFTPDECDRVCDECYRLFTK